MDLQELNQQFEEIAKKHASGEELSFEEKRVFAGCVTELGKQFIPLAQQRGWKDYVLSSLLRPTDMYVDVFCSVLKVMEELSKVSESGDLSFENAELVFQNQLDQKFGPKNHDYYAPDPVLEDGTMDFSDYQKKLSLSVERGFVETMAAFAIINFTHCGAYMHFDEPIVNDLAIEKRNQFEAMNEQPEEMNEQEK